MDKLAKQQACQLFIEQEIEKGLKSGKTKYAIGHEIAAWIKKLFEADVKPHTIEQRAHRVESQLITSVSSCSAQPAQPGPQVEPKPMKEVKREKSREEKRWLEQKRMAPDFKEAFECFFREVKNAKALKWKTTSKEACLRCAEIIIATTTIT